MKKILMTLAAVLCCTMTTTVFTACGSDDDNTNTPPAQPKVVAYQVDYSLEFPKEIEVTTGEGTAICGNIYSLCEKVEVGYTDENGQEQKEVINTEKWTKTVTYKKSIEPTVKLYIVKPTNLDIESLPYTNYTNRIKILPDELQGVTAIYDNGYSEKAPMITYKPSAKTTFFAPHKNKLQSYFDSEKLIPSEEQVLSFTLTIK